jgi:membrane-associated phospholipid phosphatase
MTQTHELYEPEEPEELYRRLPEPRRAPTMLGAGMVLLTAGLVLAAVVLGWESGLDASDRPIGVWFFDLSAGNEDILRYAQVFQVLGSGNVTGPVTLLVLAVLAVARKWGWLAWLAAVSIGGLLISEILKHAIARERPTWPSPHFTEAGYSFPSGHTLSGVTSWVAFGILLLFLLPRPWSTVLGWIVIVFGVAMGPSRLFLGVHWVTDVLGSWLIGFGWLLLVSGWFVRRIGRRVSPPPLA